MKTYWKIVISSAVAFIGLLIWNVAPDFRPLLSWVISAAIAGYIFSIIIGMTIRQVTSAELLALHERLELLDRKVTALLRDVLERRAK